MSKLCRQALVLFGLGCLLAVAGCASHSGNREFVPGKGWLYTD